MLIRTALVRTAMVLLFTVASFVLARAADTAKVAAATNDFGFRLYANLANSDGDHNLFISPLSLELALAMTYNGAHGGTQQAMAQTLGWQGLTREQVNDGYRALTDALFAADPKNARVLLANSLWLTKKDIYKSDFLQRVQHAYRAELATVDFSDPRTVARVNAWVSAHTAGMISSIVQPGDYNSLTVLSLVNALYFKGTWHEAFDAKLTRSRPFTLRQGAQKQVPMMQKSGGFDCYEDNTLQIARLPYGNGKLRMLIFLPKTTSSGNPLHDFTARLTPAQWQQWLQDLHPCGSSGTLELPRFKADYSVELSKPLSALGMAGAFRSGADFSNMVKGLDVWISTVRHKTALEVNETGTTAAAVTTVTIRTRAAVIHPHRFVMVVDHPFFFAITAEDGTMLFMGSIVDPR